MKKPYSIFISYSNEDKKLATALCNFLEDKGLKCWIAHRDINPGKEYAQSIIEAIHMCSIMVVIFTKYTNNSKHIRNEVERAFNSQLIIIPFRVENIIPAYSLEYFLSSTHWLDAFEGIPENYFGDVYRSCSVLLDGNNGPQDTAETASAVHTKKPAPQKAKKIVMYSIIVTTILIVSLVIFFIMPRPYNQLNGSLSGDTGNIANNEKTEKLSVKNETKPVSQDTAVKQPSLIIPVSAAATKKYNGKNISETTAKFQSKAGKEDFSSSDAEIPEDFNNAVFEDIESTDKLTIFGINKSAGSFQGKACSYDISGKMRLKGKLFEITSGNVTGSFAITDNFNRITGNLIIKESGLQCSPNLQRK